MFTCPAAGLPVTTVYVPGPTNGTVTAADFVLDPVPLVAVTTAAVGGFASPVVIVSPAFAASKNSGVIEDGAGSTTSASLAPTAGSVAGRVTSIAADFV